MDSEKNAYELYLKIFRKEMPIGESFDLLERKLQMGGRRASMFFVDGLTDGEKAQRIMAYLMRLTEKSLEGIDTSQKFIEIAMPFLDTTLIKPKNDNAQASAGVGNESTPAQASAGVGNESTPAQASAGVGNESTPMPAAAVSGPVAESESGEMIPLTFEVAYECYQQALPKLYAGLVLLIAEGLDNIIVIDCRDYPSRSVDEPEKEKTLRGAKDGFTESMMENVSLIRRRIRDNNLIFKVYNVGSVSKSDVVIAYMNDRANKKLVSKLDKCLKGMNEAAKEMGAAVEGSGGSRSYGGADAVGEGSGPAKEVGAAVKGGGASNRSEADAEVLSVADQSLLERLLKTLGAGGGLNPFPKVRYTQRPDITAAHIAEGKIAIIVDNSPTVMLIPVSVFEFFQDVDDYYFPPLTGNYFRLIRIVNFLVILLLTPVYLLITEYENFTPEVLKFFVPEEDFAIPIFWQFILLEVAVDALKLASLNTPTSLGMSLSVIGALILGEFSINSGWFISQTILCMAVVALAAFTQPSIELSFAMKFCRILMLVGAQIFGIAGVVGAAGIWVAILASTKTLSGESYMYPVIPFNGKALKRLIFRTQK